MDSYLSTHFTFTEATVSRDHPNIYNTPPTAIWEKLKFTAGKMELVRYALNDNPIRVNSWYRSPELNLAVRGSHTSDHMLGMAVDFTCPKYGSPVEVAKRLVKYQDMLRFKQLILEHSWVHISWESNPIVLPKLQVLSLLDGGTYAIGLTDSKGKFYV